MSPKENNNGDEASSSSEPGNESRTTILPPGAVESRNYTTSAKSQISSEIQAFLAGTDGNGATLSLRSEYRTFFTIWMFITRLPSPAWIDLHPGFLMRGMCYFPMAGTILGFMYAIVFDCMDVSLGLPASVASAMAIGFGLYLTGCFHEDGLADSADGLGGGWSKSQALKIMTDSRLGTFGVAALCLFLFVKLQLLGALGTSNWVIDVRQHGGSCSSGAGPALIVAQTLSRMSAPYLIRTRDYVAEVGPKSPFYIFMVEAKHLVSWPRVFVSALYCFVISSVFYGPGFAMALIVAVLCFAHLIGNKGEYLLGGVMGDFLGGTICICEILVLVLIVARDSIVEIYQFTIETISSLDLDRSDGIAQLYHGMLALYGSELVRPIIHLAILTVVLKSWCSLVGPPDMYDKEDSKEEKQPTEKKSD